MPSPFLHVTAVRYLGGYRLSVTFTDGFECEVDLRQRLDGEIFEPLRDESRFAEAFVDPETRTVSWPNGADLAPEFLRDVGEEAVAAGAPTRG